MRTGGRALRRRAVNAGVIVVAAGVASLAIAVLGWILAVVVSRGVSALDLQFFTSLPAPPGMEGGGLANAIVGTLLLTLVATLLAVPVGILAGVWLVEFAGRSRLAHAVRFSVDILAGIPSILVGLFTWGTIVVWTGSFSGWAGGVALAIIMVPVVARTAEDMLGMVPDSLREAALALGAPRWRSLRVVFLAARNGLVTGVLLAIARVSGETAPLLFTALNSPWWPRRLSEATANLPVTIFNYAMSPWPDWQAKAWGASLLITAGVLAVSLLARGLFGKDARWKGRSA